MAPELRYAYWFFRFKSDRPGGYRRGGFGHLRPAYGNLPHRLENTISLAAIRIESAPSSESIDSARSDLHLLCGGPGMYGVAAISIPLSLYAISEGGEKRHKGEVGKNPSIPPHRPAGPHIGALMADAGRILRPPSSLPAGACTWIHRCNITIRDYNRKSGLPSSRPDRCDIGLAVQKSRLHIAEAQIFIFRLPPTIRTGPLE